MHYTYSAYFLHIFFLQKKSSVGRETDYALTRAQFLYENCARVKVPWRVEKYVFHRRAEWFRPIHSNLFSHIFFCLELRNFALPKILKLKQSYYYFLGPRYPTIYNHNQPKVSFFATVLHSYCFIYFNWLNLYIEATIIYYLNNNYFFIIIVYG